MAISVSFRGTTIWRPGAYSNLNIALEGSPALGATGLCAIIGEAEAGPHYSEETDISRNFATPDTYKRAQAKYRKGPLVDAMGFLFSPANDGSIPNGASNVFFLKTNKSLRATLSIAPYGTVRAEEYGTGGNLLTFQSLIKDNEGVSVSCDIDLAMDTDFSGVGGSHSFTLVFNGSSVVVTLDQDYLNLVAVIADINTQVGAIGLKAELDDEVLTVSPIANTASTDGYISYITVIASDPISSEFPFASGTYRAANEPKVDIRFYNSRDLIEEEETVGGSEVIWVGCTKVGLTSATITVTDKKVELRENGIVVKAYSKKDYPTVSKLAEAIKTVEGWDASIPDINDRFLPVSAIDYVAALNALGSSSIARIKKDAYSVMQIFEQSRLVDLIGAPKKGLPPHTVEKSLGGGALGATTDADIVGALSKLEKFHINFIIPLFSRNAIGGDIGDELTDEDSDYEIEAIHQNVRNHINMMKSIKKRSERQGYLSYKDTYANSVVRALELGDARVQLFIQDVLQTDASGSITWFQPWALACLVAGARSGGSIGLPLTNKFLNASGIRHTSQPMNTEEEDIVVDFDPDLDFEDAIRKGITFCEAPFTGGFKVVLDNTTYGQDDNWVWNRGSVIFAADVAAKNIRDFLESRYVGVKNNLSVAEITSSLESLLGSLLAQGVTVPSGRAPNGYRNLVVRLLGNTIEVEVNLTLPEGIEFILSEITVERNLG